MKAAKRNLYLLTFVLFVVMLGYGIIIPIFPFYIESMGAGGMELGLLTASYAVMRLIFGPIWGGLSDRYGRKPILLIGILGYVISMVWFGLANTLWMLFAARILSGILSSATAPTTMAYIGDSSPEDERGGGMGLLGAAGGIGTIVGPAMGGFLASMSLSTPFFIAAGLALASLILAALFLPESHPAKSESKEPEAIVDLHAWREAVFSPIGPLFVLTFISTSGLMVFATVFGLYGLERFNYGPDQVGIIMMVLGLVAALTQGLVAGPTTKNLGDALTIKIGLLFTALSFGMMPLANTFWTVVLTTAIFAMVVSILSPALLSLISRRTTFPQGISMGLNNSFVSLGRILGPILGGVVLDINLNLPYLSGAAIMLIGFFCSLLWIRSDKQMLQVA